MRKVSTKETINLINKIEDKLDVHNWVVEGIHIWPIIRMHLAFSFDSWRISKKSSNAGQLAFHLRGLFRLFLTFINNIFSFDFASKKTDVLFITYSKAKHNLIDGKWFDSYVNPISKILDESMIRYKVIEYAYDYNYRLPSHNRSRIIQHRLFINTILAKKYERKIVIDNHTSLLITKIKEILKKNNLDDNIISEKLIKKKLSQIIINCNYFENLLKKYLPKVVFGSNYYGLEMAMNLACGKMKIKSVDIQHGGQGDYHVAYGRWNSVPEEGYNMLPDVFAVWGEYEKETIEFWAHNTKHSVIIIGHPLYNYLSNERKNSFDNKKFINSKTNVLISLQTTRGLIELYEQIIKISDNNIFWWIRIHPNMSDYEIKDISNKLKKIDRNNYNMDIASNTLLLELLYFMDAHITETSTVTAEAALLGVSTILVHELGKDFYEREITQENAFYIKDSEAIIRKIYSLKQKNKQTIGTNINFKESILSLLDNQIK